MLDLGPIKERLAAATPGEWGVEVHLGPPDSGGSHVIGPVIGYGVATTGRDITECPSLTCGHLSEADAEFIANSKADVAELAAEVHRLRVALDAAAGSLDDSAHVVVFIDGFVASVSDETLDELVEEFPDQPVHYLFDRREAGL